MTRTEQGASSAPCTPEPEGFTLRTPISDFSLLGREEYIRLSIRGYGSEWLLAQESLGKSPGESSLSPGDYSLAFTGRKASGQAASPPGQKHDVENLLCSLSIISGKIVSSSWQAVSAAGVQRTESFGAGSRGPQRPSPPRFVGDLKFFWKEKAHFSATRGAISLSSRPLFFSPARRMLQSFSKNSTGLPFTSRPRAEVEVSCSWSAGRGLSLIQRTKR